MESVNDAVTASECFMPGVQRKIVQIIISCAQNAGHGPAKKAMSRSDSQRIWFRTRLVEGLALKPKKGHVAQRQLAGLGSEPGWS